jgi:hypothetical protein
MLDTSPVVGTSVARRTLVGLLVAVAVSSVGLPGCDSNADLEPPPRVQAAELFDFGSLEEMMAASDVVVEGTVVVLSPGRIVGGDPASSRSWRSRSIAS